jgi:hypothetical protein
MQSVCVFTEWGNVACRMSKKLGMDRLREGEDSMITSKQTLKNSL